MNQVVQEAQTLSEGTSVSTQGAIELILNLSKEVKSAEVSSGEASGRKRKGKETLTKVSQSKLTKR